MVRLDVTRVTGYAVAVVTGGFGLAVLFNLVPLRAEPTMRRMLGIVLLLMCAYRVAVLQTRHDDTPERRRPWDE
jgi:hypothetical protein